MWQNIKKWVVEQVLWAETHLKGKTGKEKRAAVVEKLNQLIDIPYMPEWIEARLIGLLVDLACEKMNWLTDWNFSGVELDAQRVGELAEVLDAPLPTKTTAATVDERIDEMYKQYKVAPVEKPLESVAVVSQAASDWDKSIAFTLKWEGKTNFDVIDGKPVLKKSAKADKGGPTAYGITLPTLEYAYASGVVGRDNIAKLTQEEAKAIYKKIFWDRYGWGELAWPVCMCALDCSVNHGGFAFILQRACNTGGAKLDVDGKYGPKTQAALVKLSASPDVALSLAQEIVYERKAYFDKIIVKDPSQEDFRKGWYNRLRDMAALAGVKSPV